MDRGTATGDKVLNKVTWNRSVRTGALVVHFPARLSLSRRAKAPAAGGPMTTIALDNSAKHQCATPVCREALREPCTSLLALLMGVVSRCSSRRRPASLRRCLRACDTPLSSPMRRCRIAPWSMPAKGETPPLAPL